MAVIFISILMSSILLNVNGASDYQWMYTAPNAFVCLRELSGELHSLDETKAPCLFVCMGMEDDWIDKTYLINLANFKKWIRHVEIPNEDKESFITGAPFCLTAGADAPDKCAAGKAILDCLRRVS